MDTNIIPIVIPSYEPDDRLIDLLKDLASKRIGPIIIVNDGSSSKYDTYFEKAKEIIQSVGGKVLTHEVNKGKGVALKTAFSFILDNYDAIGCITCDSDGQHTPSCIERVKRCLKEHPFDFILGVRDFDVENVPKKSRIGNKLTVKSLKFFTGISISDTQTGLRGIPSDFMRKLLNVKGERFEFETYMLIESKDNFKIREVKIETVYDSYDNHKTHFNPIKDSIKIYKIFGEIFLKFLIASISSSVIDIVLFAFFCRILYKEKNFFNGYIFWAAVYARIISALYNFSINYVFVFKSKESKIKAIIKYAILAVIQMILSASSVALLCHLFGSNNKIYIKILVDIILFCISYYIQQMIVYRKREKL